MLAATANLDLTRLPLPHIPPGRHMRFVTVRDIRARAN